MNIILSKRNSESIETCLVSLEDYEKVSQYKWHKTLDGYVVTTLDKKAIRMHHFILGKPPDRMHVIDHINRIRTDNRRENLRLATVQLNSHNRVLPKAETNTSKYVGVRHKKNRQSYSWAATYCKKHLGAFDTEDEAAKAYDTYVYQLFGANANLNLVYSEEEKEEMLTVHLGKAKRDLPTGVSWDPRRNTFEVKYKCKFLGYRTDLDKAKELYDSAKEAFIKEQDTKRLSLPIQRNEDGIAILIIKNRKTADVKHVLVDDDDWHDLMRSSWCNRTGGYAAGNIDSYSFAMHRYIMRDKLAEDESLLVDHINGDKLDNRKSNLRVCTYAENGKNKRRRYNSASKYKGVRKSSANRYTCTVTCNGKTYTKCCLTEEDAARAYNEKAKEWFGEFACLNVIDE